MTDPMSQPLLRGDLHRLGDYELIGRLGEGGMGTVFLGRGGEGRLVAIKVVVEEAGDFPAAIEFSFVDRGAA